MVGGAGCVSGPPPAGGAGGFVPDPAVGVVVGAAGVGDTADEGEELRDGDGLVDDTVTAVTGGFPLPPESFVNAAIAVPPPTTTRNAATMPTMSAALERPDFRLAVR